MSGYFVPGWHPDYADEAREKIESQGGYVTLEYGDDSALPEAISLSSFIRWPYDQGPVGSCFANAAAQQVQILTASDNSDGFSSWELYQLSRAFIWHEGRKLDGLLGNRSDGGSVSNAVLSTGNVGVPKEQTWPYKPNHNYLERTPPADVYAEANTNRVTAIAQAPIDKWKRSLKNLDPISIGIWWPYGWDNDVDSNGRVKRIGSGEYGHALVVIGYIEDWDGHLWWQIENSHGGIYNPVPEKIQKRIPGYRGYSPNNPSKVYSFWVRDDMIREVMGYGNSEAVAAAGINGFRKKPLPWGRVL